MNVIDRRSVLLLLAQGFAFPFLACDSSAVAETAAFPEERVIASVSGYGNTGNEAKADAEKKAREISGGTYVVEKVSHQRNGEKWLYQLKFSYAKRAELRRMSNS